MLKVNQMMTDLYGGGAGGPNVITPYTFSTSTAVSTSAGPTIVGKGVIEIATTAATSVENLS
jgi:hypothetical protein